MRLQKHAAVQQYLAGKFPECKIEQRYDFDRGAQGFKIDVADGSLLLKVADDFIDDNDITEILRRFDKWKLHHLLRNEQRQGIMVTENGPSNFERNY
jgi:hypothetical protein